MDLHIWLNFIFAIAIFALMLVIAHARRELLDSEKTNRDRIAEMKRALHTANETARHASNQLATNKVAQRMATSQNQETRNPTGRYNQARGRWENEAGDQIVTPPQAEIVNGCYFGKVFIHEPFPIIEPAMGPGSRA